MDNKTFEFEPGLLADFQELKTITPKLARANPLMGLLGEVLDPPTLNVGATPDMDAAYAAQDRMNKNEDLNEYGYVSWEENIDYEHDEDGNEIPGDPYALIVRTEVYPQHRRKGYGKQLVKDAIREIQTEKPGLEIKLFPEAFDVGDTGLDDEQLWKWYESLGFAPDESSPIGVMIYEGPDLTQPNKGTSPR
jgi:GNAT superfamily N-acetyltransferase|tara:strand:- start:39 stop:614 length:576 start_codon:yes stop_codon:yes gene_type:complete